MKKINKENLIRKICYEIPKAELHLHIEGTLEAFEILRMAEKNNIKIPFKNEEEIKEKYKFIDKNKFIDVYLIVIGVIQTEEDFTDLMYNYIKRQSSEGVIYAEVSFNPGVLIERGISFETMMQGYIKGIKKGREDFGLEAKMILAIARHLDEEIGFKCLELAKNYLGEYIIAVGLDSYEEGNPPEKFYNLFKMCKEMGLKLTAHAEEGPVENMRTLIEKIKVDRIDHGFNIIKNSEIMDLLIINKIPLAMCPVSNYKLGFDSLLTNLNIQTLMNKNILVSISSDDPGFFVDYIGENYYKVATHSNLNLDQIVTLAKNSFESSFLNRNEKDVYIKRIDEYLNNATLN